MGTYTTGTGRVLGNVHDPSACEGRGCCIHHPSDHHMRDWPTNWRDGGPGDIKPAHMERICRHGIGHPDPDDEAFLLSIGEDIGVHGCDGCCHPGGRPIALTALIEAPNPSSLVERCSCRWHAVCSWCLGMIDGVRRR